MDAGGQAHEGRRRAEEHGVDVDRKGLRKALLDGMGDHGGSGGVRRGTDTGFVRVQASLDAVDQAGTGHAAEDGLEVEGVFEDDAEHVRDVLDVREDDDEGDEDIEDAHGRNDGARELDDPLAAAEDAVPGRDGEDGADDGGGGLRVVERVRLERGLQVVRAEQLKTEGVGHQQEEAEEQGRDAGTEGLFDVVGRAAVRVAVGVFLLVDLGERTLRERGGRANETHEPHPEDGSGAAKADRRRNTDDVAGADAGRGGDDHGLEGRDLALLMGLFRDEPAGFLELPDLHETGAGGEVEAAKDQDDNQDGVVHEGVDLVEDVDDHRMPCLSGKLFNKHINYNGKGDLLASDTGKSPVKVSIQIRRNGGSKSL